MCKFVFESCLKLEDGSLGSFRGYSMVNNAGVGGTENHGMVHEMTEETWDSVMSVNSRSVFLGCKYACAQFMNQAPHPSGHRGWIINTSSIMGLVGQAVYGGMLEKLSHVAQTSTNEFLSQRPTVRQKEPSRF